MNEVTTHKGQEIHHVVGTSAHDIAESYGRAMKFHERNGGVTRAVRERLNRERKAAEADLDIVDAEVVGAPAGPDPADVAEALTKLQAELESPEFAEAFNADVDAIVAAKAADEAKADTDAATLDPEPEPDVPELTDDMIAGMDRNIRLARAKAESREKKQAMAAGKPVPATPVIDWMERNPTNTLTSTGRPKNGTGAAKSTGARRGGPLPEFLIDGKVMALKSRPFTLTYLAEKVDKKKGTTKAFRDMLVAAGIADPDHSAWTHTLADGRVLEARLPSGSKAS